MFSAIYFSSTVQFYQTLNRHIDASCKTQKQKESGTRGSRVPTGTPSSAGLKRLGIDEPIEH